MVIPKIYEGMFPVENKKGLSLISRVIARTVIVTGVAFLIATVDLAIGYGRNNEYESNVSGARTEILNVLEEYGYETEPTNPKFASFSKELDGGERRSRVGYTFDRSGNITNVNVQLYYAPSTASATDELLFIISTINDDFDEEEVEEFIDLVEESVAGNYQNGILKGDNYKLTLGRSEDYLDIHSY